MKDCILHNPRCTKSRETLKLLQERGVELPVVEYLQQPLSKTELREICKLLGVRRDGVLRVPAVFVQPGAVLKGLPGTLTLLADCGFSDDEALRWLFTADDSLPGSPVQALVENRGTEVKRRAQALAL